MARIRTIKPEFFRHEGLQDLEAANPGSYVMLVFAGLWGHCDKAGRFEWKPRTLKLDILPFLTFDMAETLAILERAGQVRRYEVDGKQYGEIASFAVHQRIGGKESQEPGKHPEPLKEESRSNGEATGKQLGLQEGKGREEEGKGKGKEARAKAPALDCFPVPDWIPREPWDAWIASRVKLKKAPTEEALHLAVRKLGELRDGGSDPAAVLEQSTLAGWTGLFALRANRARASPADRQAVTEKARELVFGRDHAAA